MLKNFIKSNITISSLLIISLIIIINNFFRFFRNNSAYEFDPWLSNYQGGFVRRGIPGEIFYQINSFSGLHLGWLTFIFVSFLYIFFYFNFFKIIQNIKIDKLFAFIILSPLSFYFPILNSKASGHKEILFLFFLSLLCLIIPKINKKKAIKIIILICIFVALSYEVLIFYFIYLIIPFIFYYNFKNFSDLIKSLLPILAVCLGLLILNYYFSGTNKHTLEICDSVEQYVNTDCKKVGKIADLGLALDGHESQKSNWNYGETSLYPAYFIIYGVGFILGFLPLLILYKKITINKLVANRIRSNVFLTLFFMFLFSIPVFYLGADWGRYLYISYMSSLIFTLFCIKNKIFVYDHKEKANKSNFFIRSVFFISVIIYCFGWTVQICCEKNFKPGISKVLERAMIYYNKKVF